MNRIALIIALLVSTALSADDQEQFEREIAAARRALFERFGHPIPVKRLANQPAIRRAIEAFLKANANDPRKVQIARIGKAVSTAGAYKWMGGWTYRDYKPLGVVRKGFWEPIGRRGVAVAVRYRATNRMGALVVDDKVFCISNGVVFDLMELKDFHPTRPKKRSDPFTDAFMKLAR